MTIWFLLTYIDVHADAQRRHLYLHIFCANEQYQAYFEKQHDHILMNFCLS